jgi:glycosyltransferase involved in cell wall biosynthesis
MLTPGAVEPPVVSVVIPARDAAATLGACLRGLASQSLPSGQYEVIVVIDRDSRDGSGRVARDAGVTVLISDGSGAAAARNAGITAARGPWVAFTDADCIPSRTWLRALLNTVDESGDAIILGAAGRTLGYRSTSAAARFVDLSGGLHADRYLAHDRYPWAPTGNLMYRREALVTVGGFDERFRTYEGCDLHTRLRRSVGGSFAYAPDAVVMHHHRAGWRRYWDQQVGYGLGYGQFFRRYEGELPWGAVDEVQAWATAMGAAARALVARGDSDAALVAKGSAVKLLAQRVGFVRSYWNPLEARRWRRRAEPAAESAP